MIMMRDNNVDKDLKQKKQKAKTKKKAKVEQRLDPETKRIVTEHLVTRVE